MPAILERLSAMSSEELESIYRGGSLQPIGPGWVRGRTLLAPGTWRGRLLSRGSRLVWQGKRFDPDGASAINRFFGLPMIRGQVYEAASLVDGQPSLILDYTHTSWVFARYRDEIRQVAPGVYLGKMYDVRADPPVRKMFFVVY